MKEERTLGEVFAGSNSARKKETRLEDVPKMKIICTRSEVL